MRGLRMPSNNRETTRKQSSNRPPRNNQTTNLGPPTEGFYRTGPTLGLSHAAASSIPSELSPKSHHRRSHSGPAFSEDIREDKRNEGSEAHHTSINLAVAGEVNSTPMLPIPPIKSKEISASKRRVTPKKKTNNKREEKRIIKRDIKISSMSLEENVSSSNASTSEFTSLICTMCYHGFEVIFAAKRERANSNKACLLAICARTYVPFQKLEIESDSCLISLVGNTLNGIILATTKDGNIFTFTPVEISTLHTEPNQCAAPFGRYHWDHGKTIHCNKAFQRESFSSNIQVSLSRNYLVLVAYQNQMAIFDISPFKGNIVPDLLWSNFVESTILHAKLSGDGGVIAAVLEGEGEGVPYPYGVRTFIRQKIDGLMENKEDYGDGSFVDLFYKTGPFLVHSTPVSRISWRMTGSDSGLDGFDHGFLDGNDYLLTHCKEDSSLRVFSQATFKQLMHWTTPPGSRADWIMGISAANIGDLDAQPKKNTKNADENLSFISPHEQRNSTTTYLPSFGSSSTNGISHTPIPSSAAGAWIAELTFRGLNPALRLSRLSYMKSGTDDFHPAHFESVAAILPHGCLIASAVLGGEESSFSVQGIWPVWNPWSAGAISGGLSGSHSPPSELRIIARHKDNNKIFVTELPLWGDKDFGAMEFGSPLTHSLSLSYDGSIDDNEESDEGTQCGSPQSLSYESSRLKGFICQESNSISLTWFKQGSMSILPIQQSQSFGHSSSTSLNAMETLSISPSKPTLKKFQDVSICPLPMSLPQLVFSNKEKIKAMRFWQEEDDLLPRIIVFFANHLCVYELPPLWNAFEPPMPFSDSLLENSSSVHGSQINSPRNDGRLSNEGNPEYEVMITPHPDFGIGLRLEAQAENRPAIVGNYKKHPLGGGRLPAEKSGLISIGDELLAVNGQSLDGISFEDIVETVRNVGASTKSPLCLRFRKADRPEENSENGEITDENARAAVNRKKDENNEASSLSLGSIADSDFFFLMGRAPTSFKLTNKTKILLQSWKLENRYTQQFKLLSTSLLFVLEGKTLKLYLLSIVQNRKEPLTIFLLGSFDLPKEIILMESPKTDSASNKWFVSLYDIEGLVSFVVIEIDLKEAQKFQPDMFDVTFQHCDGFKTVKPTTDEIIFRVYSVQLVGVMAQISHRFLEIKVWSASPKCHEDSLDCFKETIVPFDSLGYNDTILDFCWVPSGYLDAYPWLVSFSRSHAIVHRCSSDTLNWSSIMEISLPKLMSSSYFQLARDDKRSYLHPERSPEIIFSGRGSPVDYYPHIIPSIKEIITANDELNYIRSDWHPDSILASICTEDKGVAFALQKHVRGLFTWLSYWLSPDETARPYWLTQFSKGIAPFVNVWNNDIDINELDKKERKQDNSFNELAAKPALPTETDVLLFELQASLSARLQDMRKKSGKKQKNSSFTSSHKDTGSSFQSNETPVAADIPEPLKNLNVDEIHFLYALGTFISNPPNFANLDSKAQQFLFSALLSRELLKEDKHESESETPTPAISSAQFLLKRQESARTRDTFASSANSSYAKTPGVSVGACISALLSDTQSQLLDACREKDQKLDWYTARALLLPFWLRDINQLRKIAEEIALDIFRITKSSMECALFYIAIRKLTMLQNLARTDKNDSGRKLISFLSHDFSSERGRKAAEKNAYSLLRKRQYGVAAAFFLLPEPPMINSALEVIVNQMEDVSLAFFIARLIESGTKDSSSSFGANALMLSNYSVAAQNKEENFDNWEPKLGPSTAAFFTNRLLPMSGDNLPLKSLILIWLNRKEEASKHIVGTTMSSTGDLEFKSDLSVPTLFDIVEGSETENEWKPSKLQKSCSLLPILLPSSKPFERVIMKSNSLIDFFLSPFLLKSMKADTRVRCSSAIHLSRALLRRGIEIFSFKVLKEESLLHKNKRKEALSTPNINDIAANEEIHKRLIPVSSKIDTISSVFDSFDVHSQLKSKTSKNTQQSGDMSSSIFDSFDAPKMSAQSKTLPNSNPSATMSSSIFDAFDVPAKSKQKQAQTTGQTAEMSSSIFDSYDVHKSNTQVKTVTSSKLSGEMSSSIFDTFDVPSQTSQSKPKPSVQSGEMSSSIFDSFDVPKSTVKPKVVTNSNPSGAMNSSIFDSFDVPPQPKPNPVQTSRQTEEMTSSIFDSFDVPKQNIQPKVSLSHKPSGDMSSSIFDSFDTPSQSRSKQVSNTGQTDEASSSIFDSFDAPSRTIAKLDKSSAAAISEASSNVTAEKFRNESKSSLLFPTIWFHWRDDLLLLSASRRLVREMIRIISNFHGEAVTPSMHLFRKQGYPLVPHNVANILHGPCDGNNVLSSIKLSLKDICESFQLTENEVVREALSLISISDFPKRLVLSVLLYITLEREDLAEGIIRSMAQELLCQCNFFVLSNDDIEFKNRTLFHFVSQFVKRKAARLSWQMELCLWLHRGGVFPLSEVGLKESTISVRIGMLLASWGKNFESLETLIRSEPDCPIDHSSGQQLWTSLKIMNQVEEAERKSGVCKSGGWEFLVDCRRDEATNLLRDRRPGTFIIRPHPEDHGVFTLSFKTNLVPNNAGKKKTSDTNANKSTMSSSSSNSSNMLIKSKIDKSSTIESTTPRNVYPDDVVQHAIIRLSDAGFRCGSFGPYPSLLKLLEAVSSSLPFPLLFDEPPEHGIIKEQGGQPSPNSIFLRKLALHSKSDHYRIKVLDEIAMESENLDDLSKNAEESDTDCEKNFIHAKKQSSYEMEKELLLIKQFRMFSHVLILTSLCKQISGIAAAITQSPPKSSWQDDVVVVSELYSEDNDSLADDISSVFVQSEMEDEDIFFIASRIIRPLLRWCRSAEVALVAEFFPRVADASSGTNSVPIDVAVTDTAIEAVPIDFGSCSVDGGDAMVRRIIQPNSGVEFRALRIGEGISCAIVILFSKKEASSWLISHGEERDEVNASDRLRRMEKRRVIEELDLVQLSKNAPGKGFLVATHTSGDTKQEIRYRVVDPWEVESLDTKEAETACAALGREYLLSFNISTVARSCEKVLRDAGGVHLLSLWNTLKGGIYLTKSISSTLPPWERDTGSDLRVVRGIPAESSSYMTNIRKHLYRNTLFRRLKVPQRFIAILQIELLDLKNLTSPGGASPLSAYALLRLKRSSSNAPLNHKVRTIDSACTRPKKIYKTSGPHAPASWGTLVRFRFVLPEDVNVDGTSYDRNRDALFRGPPSVLQISVYEKKFMSDQWLGSADVKLNAVGIGDQLEEWVPLRAGKDGIVWFARVRIMLRFELMCLDIEEENSLRAINSSASLEQAHETCPSAGLRIIENMSKSGGVYEDSKTVKKNVSTPDFLSYLENMTTF